MELKILRGVKMQNATIHDIPAGQKLPYLAQISPRTILLRDGSLMQMIRIAGFAFETADTSEIDHRKHLREAMLRAIGSSRFAIYHHIVRRRVFLDEPDRFPDDFSQRLDDLWRRRIEGRQLYRNDLVVTLVRRPASRGSWHHALLRRGSASQPAAEMAAEERALDAAREQVEAALAGYGPSTLVAYEDARSLFSEPLEFLSQIFNGWAQPMQLPSGDLGHHIPARRVCFHNEHIEWSRHDNAMAQYAAVVSVKDYPGWTLPGMLDDLTRLPYEMVITQSFAFVGRDAVLGRMNGVIRRMRASDDEAVTLRCELAAAKDEVAAGKVACGEHHLSIMIRAETLADVDAGVADVQAALADLGIVSVREDLGLEAAYWAQFPGNFGHIARRSLVSTANFASFASLHNFSVGQDRSHWGKAISTFETTAAGPYQFNFHHGDLGNFLVIGPSGSGKTVIVNFLLAQAQRHRPRTIFFDKDRGAEPFIRAIGGHYDVLRPGFPSGLNPLMLDNTPANRSFLCRWIAHLAGDDLQALSAGDQALIADAVDSNFAAPMNLRRLGCLVDLLRGSEPPHDADLYARLGPWWGSGRHAWLFDNDNDRASLAQRTIGFDMTLLLDYPALRTPAMMYLFHRVDERLDGDPTIIVVDEGWKALDDPVFAHHIRDWEKTIRKRNGLLGFVTQNAQDALASCIAGAIVEQSATQIFTPNPRARAEDYIEGFGLTRQEFDLIVSLPDSARCFLVKQGQDSVVLRLDLTGAEECLTILSGRESTARKIDAILREQGEQATDWLSRLTEIAPC